MAQRNAWDDAGGILSAGRQQRLYFRYGITGTRNSAQSVVKKRSSSFYATISRF
jgi:hypothetical protein